jgi:L-rhamnose-H+ transport protein
MVGIIISGMAGTSKERELTSEQKQGSVSEFNFLKGMIVALFAGVLSAAMAFGLDAGAPIAAAAKQHLIAANRSEIWQGLPELIVILLGGFATNFVWCVFLNIKNRSTHQYISFRTRDVTEISAAETISTFDLESTGANGGRTSPVATASPAALGEPVPVISNYLLAGLAGVTWYFQFFFYTMGSTKMGEYGFSSWTLHMASIIIFSIIWGIFFKEWKGTSQRTKTLIGIGLAVLVLSTIVVGLGNYLKAHAGT